MIILLDQTRGQSSLEFFFHIGKQMLLENSYAEHLEFRNMLMHGYKYTGKSVFSRKQSIAT